MHLRTPTDFGAAIRSHRLRASLTQAALARKVGVSRQWIVEIEKGKPSAPLALILRALAALNITLQIGEAVRDSRHPLPRNRPVNLDSLLNNLRRKNS